MKLHDIFNSVHITKFLDTLAKSVVHTAHKTLNCVF